MEEKDDKKKHKLMSSQNDKTKNPEPFPNNMPPDVENRNNQHSPNPEEFIKKLKEIAPFPVNVFTREQLIAKQNSGNETLGWSGGSMNCAVNAVLRALNEGAVNKKQSENHSADRPTQNYSLFPDIPETIGKNEQDEVASAVICPCCGNKLFDLSEFGEVLNDHGRCEDFIGEGNNDGVYFEKGFDIINEIFGLFKKLRNVEEIETEAHHSIATSFDVDGSMWDLLEQFPEVTVAFDDWGGMML